MTDFTWGASNVGVCHQNNDTQEYIATIIGTIQTNYSKYERGETLILTSYIIEFAKHYNISIDWLCGKTKDSEIK